VLEGGVLELDGDDDGLPDRGIVGMRMRAPEIAEHRPFMGTVAISAVFGAHLLRCERAINADLFVCRAALDRVQLVAAAPQLESGVEQRLLRRACDDGCDLLLC